MTTYAFTVHQLRDRCDKMGAGHGGRGHRRHMRGEGRGMGGFLGRGQRRGVARQPGLDLPDAPAADG